MASIRSIVTQLPATARPPVIKRSTATPLAATTRPTELTRSFTTRPASRTRPTVLKRSIATPPATRTRPTVLMRWVTTTQATENTAIGYQALLNNTAAGNTALGYGAGSNLTTGNDNIDIGNDGVAGDAGIIRIGRSFISATFIAGIYGATASGGAAVFVNSAGQLGTSTSSRRFKDQIKPMEKASEALFGLNPVTFRYKKEIDPEGIPQFGLVAEEVEKVNPDLVVRGAGGKVYTVRYEAVNAMLLNEFLKEHKAFLEEHRTVQELKSTVAKQKAIIAQQQKGMESVIARLKEQDSKIQKVNEQLELNKAAPQMALNNQ